MIETRQTVFYSNLTAGKTSALGQHAVRAAFNQIDRGIDFSKRTSKSVRYSSLEQKNDFNNALKSAERLTEEYKDLIIVDDAPFILQDVKDAKKSLYSGNAVPSLLSTATFKSFNKTIAGLIEKSKKTLPELIKKKEKEMIAYSKMINGSEHAATGKASVKRNFTLMRRAITSCQRTLNTTSMTDAAKKKEFIKTVDKSYDLYEKAEELIKEDDAPFALQELKDAKQILFVGNQIPSILTAEKLEAFNGAMAELIEKSEQALEKQSSPAEPQ